MRRIFSRDDQRKQRRFFDEKMADVRTRYSDLLEELKSIPHLPVQLEFDHERAFKEVMSIDEWIGNTLDLKNLDKAFIDRHKKNYCGRTLRGLSSDSADLVDREEDIWDYPSARFSRDGELLLHLSDLAEHVPYLRNWIEQPGFPPTITRVIRFKEGHGLYWHSHHNGPFFHPHYNYGFMITVIKTNPHVINGVRYNQDETTATYKNYAAGTTHVLNGWYDHQVQNLGVDVRYNLQHILNLNEEKTLLFLKPFVDAYNGPRIYPHRSCAK